MKKTFLFVLTMLFAFVLNAQDRAFEYRDSRAGTHWQPVSYGTSSQTATIIGVIDFEGTEQQSNQLEIGVFHGDVCRGASLSSVPALGRYLVFLTVYGNNGEEDIFKVYDHATGTELDMTCNQTYTYHDDDIIGSIPDPYVFSFVYNHFEINASADPETGGTVTGSGTYDRDATVTLVAAANEGYSFTEWTKDGVQVSTLATYGFTATMASMGDYVAHFAPIPYEITATANPTMGGTVTGGGTHDFGTSVTLAATPATGYHFVNWTKDGTEVSTSASYSFVVSGDATYVANFELNSYAITVSANPPAGGTVSGGGTYNHFANCTLTAMPSTGYHFLNWTKNGTVLSTEATYPFEVVGAGDYVANFELNSYEIGATPDPAAGGTIEGAGTYNHFATCELSATVNTGYHFVNWTLAGDTVTTSPAYSFEVSGPATYVAHFKLNSYAITVSADPNAGGTVDGGGTYNHFETCTLMAVPSTGYHFVNWTKDGEEVSTSATYEFEVSGGGAYVAHFELNSYEITATADPTAGGTVTGAGTYNHFETCTLTATANTGYTFVNWTKDGMEVSTDMSINFMVEGAASYVAHFNLNSYEITATVDPLVGGTVTGAGTYNHFETSTLTATPSTGYHFVSWTLGGTEVSTSASYSFEVNGPASYVAHFAINNYTITVTANPTAGGMVTGGGNYDHFATCEITATPATGYHFVNWTVEGTVASTQDTLAFEVSGPVDYVANFELNSYEITATVDPAVGGTVNGTGTYNHFETCTLTAVPATGYHFVKWTKDGAEVSTSVTLEFEVNGPAAYLAIFAINNYAIAVTANPTVGGTVTGTGNYDHFATCEITATPVTGYHFVNWTLEGVEVSTSATYSFEVTGAANYVGNFELNSYEITAVADTITGGTITGAGIYNHFENCTLTASANTGYTFVNWTKDGVEVSTDLSITFMVEGAASYVAHFSLNSYEITVVADPAVGGAVSGTGTYYHFSTCEVTATSSTGYHFVNWTLEGVEVSTSATYSFEVSGTATYVANFALNSYGITATADPTAGGTVTGAGTYNHFETCTLTASANTGYTFVNWTKDGVEVSTDLSINFMVEGAASYVAHFNLNSYEITATVDPLVGGTVTGAGTYNHFETCTLTATPSIGYHFVNWTLEGTEVSTSASYAFEVSGPASYVAHFAINNYTITVTANPTTGGTVTGGGNYDHFATCEITATPSTGYHFVNWTLNGTEVSTSATYSFEVSGAAAYVANFELNSYEIKATANPTVGGTFTGAGTYSHFETCTLTALPSTGYHFVNWIKDGAEVSTDLSISFTVEGDASYMANFEINNYAILVTANPTAGGTVTGAGNYDHFATCEVTATSSTGYHFVNWTLNGAEVSTSATYSFEVSGPATYVANFELNSYVITATANPTAGGTITGAGTYNHFETCTLTASANTGYTFVNWTKDGVVVSTDLSISFTVEGAAVYVAHFEINNYVISVSANPTAGGTVTGGGNYDHFATCEITATPSTGYHFVNWTLNGTEVSTSVTYSFVVSGPATYVANFELNSYVISATANPTVGGTVTGAGTYNHFETCTLTASPNMGYTFVNWTKDGVEVSTDLSISFMVEAAASYVAHFNLNSYEITATVDPLVGGTVTGAGTYNHFETCTLTAMPSTGYHFVNWTLEGTEISTSASYSFEVNGPASYVAHFAINNYTITVTANPTAGGTVTGGGNYDHFTPCEITATPVTGYHFVNWTLNGTEVSTSATYSFEVSGAAAYVANFELNSYEITATANPTAGGTVTGVGTYSHFETCTLTAVANTGYTFVNWTQEGVVVSTSVTYSFEVNGSSAYVANFQLNSYAITVTANPVEGGTVTGAGTYNHFESCTLTATPIETYIFLNWTKDGLVVSTDPTYTFTVTEAGDYVANFALGYVDIVAYGFPFDFGTVSGAGPHLIGSMCTLTALPYEGFYFVKWSKGTEVVSTDAEYTFEVTEAATYRAHFARIQYTISAEANPEEGGTISGTGNTFTNNTMCQLIAQANEGYSFVNWTRDGEVVSTDCIYEFMISESAHFVANFVIDSYEITAEADPEEGGTVTGAGTYTHGETVTMTAVSNPEFRFLNWTEDDEIVSEEATFTFEATQDRHLVAHFASTVGVGEQDEMLITVYPNPATERLFVECEAPVNQCDVYNVAGSLVLSVKDCPSKFEIGLDGLASGTYIIRLTSDQMVQTRRFVKQ